MILALLLLLQESERAVRDDATGEITIAGNASKMVLHADPSKWHVITDMVVFRGRLLASASYDFDTDWFLRPWGYSNGAQILEFETATGEWKVIHELAESMILNVRVVGDRVMLPEFYPLNERSRLVHTYDGKAWDALGLLPQQNWHVMDVIESGGKLYVSGSWRDLEQKNDPAWWPGYGRVFVSEDGGKTWTQIHRTKENGRILDLVEFKGKLYGNEIGKQLIAWDGKKWDPVPVKLDVSPPVDAKLGSAHLMAFADRIVAINADLYYLFDGKKWTSHTPGYIDLWKEGKTLYGLRDNGHVYTTADAVKWERATRDPVPEKEFARMAEKGRPLHRGAVALHRGRLFVGTGAEGKIYAAAYHEKGKYTSKPEERAMGEKLAVEWDAATPSGTSLKLRLRTAESRDKLEKASWKDLAKSPADVAVSKGHRWVQYRVEMESDGELTPVLRSLVLK